MCVFHLTNDHEGTSCPKNIRYQQLEAKKVASTNVIIEEESSKEPSDSVNYYLEYESDSNRGNNILLTLEEASYSVLTWGQRTGAAETQDKNKSNPTLAKDQREKRESESKSSPIVTIVPQILRKVANSDSIFDIVEFCKTSRIQISPAKYLRMNPGELNKLIEYINQPSLDKAAK